MGGSIEIVKVSKSYGKKAVLTDIDLMVKRGQIYGFIGPSGAGKTTLVKLIVGMDSFDSGTIKVLDYEMPNLEVLEKIGYMAQSDALYAELTGKENLTFFASLYKMKKAEQKKRIAYAANLVNLTDELSKRVSAYSGGMKRRLSLAIALVQDPDVLILDEPTVGIDPELRQNVWKELLRLRKENNKTIIITTHVMDEAEKCDQIAMIRDGKILTTGTPDQLKKAYQAKSLDDVFLTVGRSFQ